MKHRINHWMAWPMIAGTILAGLSLSASAQYPTSPSDNGTGVMPMAPAAMPSTPQNGDGYGIVPKPPYAPTITTRPANWVGGTSPDATPNNNLPPQGYPSTDQPLAPSSAPQLNPSTETLARIGSEAIFASEITPQVDRYLVEFKAKMSPEDIELHRQEFEMQREMLIKKSLKSHIESKLILQDVKRDIPAEGMVNVDKQLSGLFEKTELPKLMKQEGVATTKELDQKLKTFGSSISQEKKAFIEKALVGEWVRRQTKSEEDTTVTQLTHYYDTHKADFTTPAKARWEELSVSKAKYSNKDEALAAIAQMGNRVLIGGEPFAEVAKQSSDGFTAMKGGLRDWATKGSLADKEIDAAVFGLPVGSLSQIIETPQDCNIIRVIQRVEEKTEDFQAAQEKIRKKIVEERSDRKFREYLDRLEKRTPIWTIYDGFGGNLPLAERLNEKQR